MRSIAWKVAMYKCRISHFQAYHQADAKVLEQIPALQRRRLSTLAKLALHAAYTCLQNIQTPIDYIVWSSCYGDENRTVKILQDISEQQTPSPTHFSTSVHNAIAGLYSILFQDDTVSVSLSSHAQHVWQDLVQEAYVFLKSKQIESKYIDCNYIPQVLVVYYDEPLPEIYQSSYQLQQPIAVSAIISLDQPNVCIQPASLMAAENSASQIDAFLQFWHSTENDWHSHSWIWHKC